jgi:energy-coupling factor transporter transmembrane protein EcfT
MKRTFNWRLWLGLLLAIVAFVSYFAFFYQFPITRDVPWVSFALFLAAIALLISGWRRAPRKILASIVTVLGLFVAGAFTFLVTVGSKDLPASQAAPAIGQQVPDFTLPDTQGRPVSLANVLGQSNGVVLIFYRGYW